MRLASSAIVDSAREQEVDKRSSAADRKISADPYHERGTEHQTHTVYGPEDPKIQPALQPQPGRADKNRQQHAQRPPGRKVQRQRSLAE